MGFVGAKNNRLFIDFVYEKKRYRIYLKIDDTPKNRKLAEMKLNEIETEIEYENLGIKKADLSKFIGNTNNSNAEQIQPENKVELTLDEYFYKWLDEKIHISKNSRRTWLSFYNKHIKPHIGSKKIKDINENDILEIYKNMKMTLKNSVINKKIVNIKNLFNELCEEGLIAKNPFKKIKRLRNEPTNIKPFSLEELKLLFETFDKMYPHYSNFIRFLAFTGVRPNEAIALRWDCVDFENKKILIRQGYVLGEFTNLKTSGSVRDIDMTESLFEILYSQLSISGGVSEFVFINKHNNIICWENFRQKYYKVLDAAKIQRRPAYQLRHTFASLAIKNNEDPLWVAKTLGHSSLKTTLSTYSRYIRSSTREDGTIIDNFFKNLK